MNKPKISIITACYQSEATIAQTIESVIKQSYSNIEYIVIDGASTDKTISIIGNYKKNITTFITEKDNGIYDAFNKGLNVATGDYIMYLNSDDYLLHDTVIEEICEQIILNHYPNVVYGGIYIIDENSGFVKEWAPKVKLSDLKIGAMIPHPATFIRRDCMLQVGGFDCRYRIAADYNLVCKAFTLGEDKCIQVPTIVSMFRLGGMSTNLKHEEQLRTEIQQIAAEHFSVPIENQNLRESSNDSFLKKWIISQLIKDRTPATLLREKNLNQIAIFGSGEISNMLALDCKQKGIKVHAFLDNNVRRQSLSMNSIPIVAPEWMKSHNKQIQAVVFGFESYHEQSAMEQMNSLLTEDHIIMISWRELVDLL